MKAVCTILGWWIAAAAAGGGAGIFADRLAELFSVFVELFALLLVELLEADGSPAKAVRGVSLDLPLPSESEFWFVEDGAGDVISMGSPGAGGDILMVGVGIGMTRAPIDW